MCVTDATEVRSRNKGRIRTGSKKIYEVHMIDTGPGLTMEIVFAESFLTKYVDLFTSLPRNVRNSLLHGKTEGQRETESESMTVQLSVRVCKLLCLCHIKASRKKDRFPN